MHLVVRQIEMNRLYSVVVDDIAGIALWLRKPRDRNTYALWPIEAHLSERLSARFDEWIAWHGSLTQNDDDLSDERLDQQWEQFDHVGWALALAVKRELGEGTTVRYFWISLQEWESVDS